MKKSNKKIFGYHLAIDLYNCDRKIIRSIENCYRFLDLVPKIIKTNIQSPPFVIYKRNIGFAGWIPVVDSGISLYIHLPTNFATVDIYACRRFDYNEVKKFVIDFFKPEKIQEYRFLRGKKYIHPMELLKARGLI
jgi:S-adenosylmethionine/arginine decarboxylase-like enzyme